MRYRAISALGIILLSLALSSYALGQRGVKGRAVVPASSVEVPGDRGVRAHTNIRVFVPTDGFQSLQPQAGWPPYIGYLYETPASIGCIYKLTGGVQGCNPNYASNNPSGGSRAIAVVDAFDYPTAASDLSWFSHVFGLPSSNFEVVYASGMEPPHDPNWELEESLDIEWAHAMAPNATLYLVEAASNDFDDLLAAVQVGSELVAAAGGGEVSMSWGGSEFSGENALDSYFLSPGVVYFAATGDTAGTEYPSVSPNVVAVGGTSLRRDQTTGYLISEEAYIEAGGGASEYEPLPAYQSAISKTAGSSRGTPDVVADADPVSGVWVFDNGEWRIVGGTSLATPIWAGIVNSAQAFANSSSAQLTTMYNDSSRSFNDIKLGFCGPYNGYSATKGWDFCTGNGSPYGYNGK